MYRREFVCSGSILFMSGCISDGPKELTVNVSNRSNSTTEFEITVNKNKEIVFERTVSVSPSEAKSYDTSLHGSSYTVSVKFDGQSVTDEWEWSGCNEDGILIELRSDNRLFIANTCYDEGF